MIAVLPLPSKRNMNRDYLEVKTVIKLTDKVCCWCSLKDLEKE